MPIQPLSLLLVLIAPAVGSFLGVLVDRLVNNRSILSRSACASCEHTLSARELIPILSAILQNHQCRNCGALIPGHLIRIEITALAIAVVSLLVMPSPGLAWVFAGILWCLLTLFYTDLLHFRLPDPLTLTLLLLGLLFAHLSPQSNLQLALMSAAIGFAVFWVIRSAYHWVRGREGLGLGDVKLMAGISAIVGWQLLPVVTLIAAILAITAILVQSIHERKRPDSNTRLPFGSFLIGATTLVLIF